MKRKTRLRIKIVRIGRPIVNEARLLKHSMASPNAVRQFWINVIAVESDHEDEKENLCVILTDTNLRPTGWNRVSIGSIDECTAHAREIFRAAIVAAAYGIVMIHNHPSGNPMPSPADRKLTKKLQSAGELLGIALIDHVIIGTAPLGQPSSYSFRDAGILGAD